MPYNTELTQRHATIILIVVSLWKVLKSILASDKRVTSNISRRPQSNNSHLVSRATAVALRVPALASSGAHTISAEARTCA